MSIINDIWLIIALSTQLLNGHTSEYTLRMIGPNEKSEVEIFRLEGEIWNMNIKGSDGLTRPLNFRLNENTEFHTLLDNTAIKVADFFEIEDINWRMVEKINFKNSPKEGPLIIKRDLNQGQITIFQEKGHFLQPFQGKIEVSWKKE